ncbi:MAG: complex I NDUFA9 subunit family protein [Chloroflexota bacterium]
MARVFVTGGTGFVGSHVVPSLIEAGHSVVALVRTANAASALRQRVGVAEAGLTTRIGDVTDPATLASGLEGCQALVHLVALARDWNNGKDLERVNAGGTVNLVAAATAAGVTRFVQLGALGVEERADLHYANSKARAERVVRESSLDWTILKPSLIWGERDGFFNIVAALVKIPAPVVPVPGSGKSRFQPIWIGDVARTIVQVLGDPSTIHHSYELGGPRYWTYAEITQEVARALGKRRAVVPMPVPLISLVAGASELIRLPFPVATDQLRQLALDNIGATDAVEREFGFTPRDMGGRLGYLRRKASAQ